MKKFEPDYNHLIDAAYNREAKRLPLYEHGFDVSVMETITGQEISPLLAGNLADKTEGYRRICTFAAAHGYDCIPFEICSTLLIQQGKGLMGQAGALIETQEDLDAYPWEEKPQEYIDRFKNYFDALRAALPPGMKAIGGVGNGLFEMVQDFVPFQELVYLQVDEPEVFSEIWKRAARVQVALWEWVLKHYADCFAVCRFGDDLGFRSSTLLQPDIIREHVFPQYKRIVDMVHACDKPFLLHSCGKIYDLMENLIDTVGINAKHSNEDAIDTFDVWVHRYGDRIGNFGGVEMNVLTLNTPDEVEAYVRALLPKIEGHGGIAIGSGNQISSYTEPANWLAMIKAVREWRGDFR